MQAFFSPAGGCSAAIQAQLSLAQSFVRVLAYELTSLPVADYLSMCVARGVTVQVVLDAKEAKSASCLGASLTSGGCLVKVDAQHQIAHNKVIIIDQSVLITGSFNFTIEAEYGNAENLLVLPQPPVLAAYLSDFQLHWGHSTPYLVPSPAS